MKLSILICLNDRKEQLTSLMENLSVQLKDVEGVEILVDSDNGEITTGAKRNRLLAKAKGDYISFIDDDDKVSYSYIDRILTAIKTEPDVVGIMGLYYHGDNPPATFIHSIKYDYWFQEDDIFYRCPNHLNPVKRELAMQAGFPDVVAGEDHAYSVKLFPLLKTEVYIDSCMYRYFK